MLLVEYVNIYNIHVYVAFLPLRTDFKFLWQTNQYRDHYLKMATENSKSHRLSKFTKNSFIIGWKFLLSHGLRRIKKQIRMSPCNICCFSLLFLFLFVFSHSDRKTGIESIIIGLFFILIRWFLCLILMSNKNKYYLTHFKCFNFEINEFWRPEISQLMVRIISNLYLIFLFSWW